MTSFHIEFADLIFPLEEGLEQPNAQAMGSQLNYSFPDPGIIHLGETVPSTAPGTRVIDAVSAQLNEKLSNIAFGATGKPMADLDLQFPLAEAGGPFGGGKSDAECLATQLSAWGAQLGLAEDATREDYLAALANNSDAYSIGTPSEDYWIYGQHLVLADDGLPLGFATESRKCEVYCTAMLKLGRTGWPYCYPRGFAETVDPRIATWDGDYAPICMMPVQTETPEVANAGGLALHDPDFPLALTSGRIYYYHHATMRHAPFARELCPVPFVRINPKTAAEYGIEDGDWVEISSRRTQGSDFQPGTGTEAAYNGTKEQNTKTAEPIHTIAYVAEVVAPNVLWMERFWNPECFDSTQSAKTGGWQECNVNVLANGIDTNFNEAFGSYTNRGFAVNIKKSKRPDRVWVNPKEFEPFLPTTANEYVPEVGVLLNNPDMLTEPVVVQS
jgi:hypothetical protein